jgi:protein-S-isoprenylcysteine O-methyltransferase Ste14
VLGRERDGGAPHFRLWPPVAVGAPWLVGIGVESSAGISVDLGPIAAVAGWVLVVLFVAWNGWSLVLFARRRTGLLPGQTTTTLLDEGPYRVSRNPLYLGLLALYVGAALIVSSWVVLALAPLALAGLHWGAVRPEERYLGVRLGSEYSEYCRRVPRWL